MSEVSLNVGVEMLWCEAVNLILDFLRRPQVYGDANVLNYLSRKAANREYKKGKRNNCVVGYKTQGHGNLRIMLTSYMEVKWFQVYPILFWSSISLLHSLPYLLEQ